MSAERSGSDPAPPTVAVVGGGFAGLLVAREIAAGSHARVVVHEADERLGGKVLTTEIDGITVDAGPDSFLPRDPLMLELCDDLGLGDELISPAVFGGLVWTRGRLEPLPSPAIYGMPATPAAALRCTALSVRGRVRAAAEPAVPATDVSRDVSVGDFVRRRYGPEILERVVDPVLAGTRAGDVEDVSLGAALTPVRDLAASHGSIMKGLARTDVPEATRPVFYGLRSGMGSLIEALRRDVAQRAEIRFGDTIEAISDRGDYYDLVSSGGRLSTADVVVLTVPAFAAAALLRSIDASLSRAIDVEYASSASVALAYPPSSVPVPASASGVLVPRSETATISGCTFFTAKWPHLAPADGRQVIRCFVGRSGSAPALDMSDEELASATHADVRRITGPGAGPFAAAVTRWDRSLPQYRVGHEARIATAAARLENHPRLALAGAGYRGSGLPDVARGALRAARRALRALTRAQ